ncbi:MAG TPA: hypothetical protein VMW88_00725 [Thermoplasmata archaeon]|jgi:hypothetical protein|nr:hypothetical protein [Thermoplasmata archaeon]
MSAERVEDVEPAEQSEPGVQDTSDEEVPQPLAFKIIHPKSDRPRGAASPRTPFPLSFLAAVLGLLSLALPWSYRNVTQYRDTYYDAFSLFRHLIENPDVMYSAIVLMVLVGSLLCFLTSLGSLLQLGGVILFAIEMPDASWSVAAGPFVAAASAFIGIASLLLSARISVPSRFATFVRSDDRGISMNLLAGSAFVIGLASLFPCWFQTSYRVEYGRVISGETYSMMSFLFSIQFDDLTLMIIGAVLVTVGSILCLLTPIGSLLQLAGTSLAFAEFTSSFQDVDSGGLSGGVSLGAGFYLAIIAGVIGIWSMVVARRVSIPGHFVSSLVLPDAAPIPEAPVRKTAVSSERMLSRLWTRIGRISRVARLLLVMAITLAVIVAALAIPRALPLSSVEMQIYNASVENMEIDFYIDGERIDTGLLSPNFQFQFECSVTSGLHVVALDYACSGDDDPHPDGALDWSSTASPDPYMNCVVSVVLQGRIDTSLPVVTLSCTPEVDGYTLTFEEIASYYTFGTYADSISWTDLSLVVTENCSFGAKWSLYSLNLSKGSFQTVDFGTEYLGDIGLNCTVVELVGDGDANVGDQLRLEVVDGGLSESAEYTAYILHRPTGSVIGQIILT